MDETTKKAILNLPIPLCILEFDGNINWYNNKFYEMTESSDLLGENIDNINTVLEELKNNLKGKILYQITNEDFQRHLSSPSINSCGGIKKLELVKIKKLHLF